MVSQKNLNNKQPSLKLEEKINYIIKELIKTFGKNAKGITVQHEGIGILDLNTIARSKPGRIIKIPEEFVVINYDTTVKGRNEVNTSRDIYFEIFTLLANSKYRKAIFFGKTTSQIDKEIKRLEECLSDKNVNKKQFLRIYPWGRYEVYKNKKEFQDTVSENQFDDVEWKDFVDFLEDLAEENNKYYQLNYNKNNLVGYNAYRTLPQNDTTYTQKEEQVKEDIRNVSLIDLITGEETKLIVKDIDKIPSCDKRIVTSATKQFNVKKEKRKMTVHTVPNYSAYGFDS